MFGLPDAQKVKEAFSQYQSTKNQLQPSLDSHVKNLEQFIESLAGAFPKQVGELGKNSARVDSRTLRAIKYVVDLPAPRGQADWLNAIDNFPMYGNDIWGNCAIAAIGHMVQWWSAVTGQRMTPSLDEILRVYRILSPDNSGCVLLDVLNYWTKNTICGITLGALAAVNPRNQDEIKICLDMYGGLYAGAELPIAAKTQDIWDVGKGRDFSYGSWGGHCFPFGRYGRPGDVGPGFVSWGRVMQCTWPWVTEYVSEVYALISSEWLDPRTGKAPSGFDFDLLKQDLAAITA